jgi:hypothetical protein
MPSQFNKEALQEALPQQHGIQYVWMGKECGGLRKRDKHSELNAGVCVGGGQEGQWTSPESQHMHTPAWLHISSCSCEGDCLLHREQQLLHNLLLPCHSTHPVATTNTPLAAAACGAASTGWDSASFRGYADYMQSEDFARGLQQLMQVASGPQGPAAIMCAEVVYFRCHRALVSDALTARGWVVKHITNPGKAASPHKLTKFAVVDETLDQSGGCSITYPAYEHTAKAKTSSSSRKRSTEDEGGGGGNNSSSGGSSAKSSRSSRGTRSRKQAGAAGG